MKKLTYFLHFALLVVVISIAIPGRGQTNYYSNSTGDPGLTASWGTNADGSGSAPANFTAANQVFNIVNNATPTIGEGWTVSGSGSYIVVGDGIHACNFTIPSGDACTGTINVSANATLTITNTTIPTLGTLNASSTVIFNSGSGNQTIPAVTYGNLTYSGSAYGYMAGGCTILGTLSVTNGALVLDNSGTSYTYTIGSISVTTPEYLDFGSTTKSAVVNLTGNFSQSGAGYVYTTGEGTGAPNGTLNFSGTTQNVLMTEAGYVNFNVLSGSTVNLTGDFTLGAYTGHTAIFTVASGGTLNCGTYDFLNVSGLTVTSFVLSSGGTLMTGNTAGIASSGASGSIQLTSRSYNGGANYTYNGTAAQSTGALPATVNNLTINNTSTTGVTLSQAESVAGVLTMTDGLLNTTATNLITVNNGGSTTGASNSSFVNGPIAKIGSQAFTFPVGASGTGYIPIGISAPAATTDVFLAQYNRSSAKTVGTVLASGLYSISECDYWTLNHTTGTDAVNVTGYWNANSPCGGRYVNDLATIALVHYNSTSSKWDVFGNNGTTGTIASGSVTWNGVSNFSPFALGSTNLSNPLPLTLVDFNAAWQTGGTVGLTWEVQDGADINHFDIQRSADGVNWTTIGTLAASASSSVATNYSYTDAAPLSTGDYYRLQVVDDAGNDTYSTVKVLSRPAGTGITIFPNPASDHINVSFSATGVPGAVSIRLMNATGQILLQENVAQPAGQTITLPVAGYPAGSYLVQVLTAGEVKQSGIVLIIK